MDEIIKCENGVAVLDSDLATKLADFERTLVTLKAQEDELKQILFEEMHTKGIIKVDTGELTITYVEQTTRESFDSKKLRDELPDVYDEYIKISTVKPSIRIKLKK